MLTHELAQGTYDPYLADMLAPLRPLLCFGRSAKAFPTGQPRHAVMSWWRDPPQNPGVKSAHPTALFSSLLSARGSGRTAVDAAGTAAAGLPGGARAGRTARRAAERPAGPL